MQRSRSKVLWSVPRRVMEGWELAGFKAEHDVRLVESPSVGAGGTGAPSKPDRPAFYRGAKPQSTKWPGVLWEGRGHRAALVPRQCYCEVLRPCWRGAINFILGVDDSFEND